MVESQDSGNGGKVGYPNAMLQEHFPHTEESVSLADNHVKMQRSILLR
jgi:hypothetical protein